MKVSDQMYQDRIKRITKAFSHEEPDHVPVIMNAETWNVSYSGMKIEDIINDKEKEFECFNKPFENIYYDGTLFSCLSRDVEMYELLGGGAYFYSDDGVTIQHKEYVFMNEDEYPKLIHDPMSFTIDEIFPRKYSALRKSYPENVEILKKAKNMFLDYLQRIGHSAQYIKENSGIPTLVSGIGQAPFDVIMDYYRGFKETMQDARRRPEEIIEATNALVPVMMKNIKQGKQNLESYPFVYFPLHAPSFLSPKQFEKLYWPSFKEVLNQTAELGGKAILHLEGNWEHLYDFINEVPKDFAIALLEKDDIFKAKDKIGDTLAICGGIELGTLRASKSECIEVAKRVIDKCAPGGGFMFCTDKALLTPGDVKLENLIAVNEFVHSYGKY
ncbi:uroporphyrinogen decarboxylase family protein [Alkalibacter mobilis]|uniref:uroporphyrinogen decarboxylase family protein n=1 Tax=Alkalibacter mobilis TaxID=2787712 RepID=UPI00189F53EA|nr:uroporphyrinogen decarboxylase family protein [Alkalibacter mobilis]MBF7097667.1 hypothetical protein [Alkalibacter mobilis]